MCSALIAITIGCGDDSNGGTGGSGATGGTAGTGGSGGTATLSVNTFEGTAFGAGGSLPLDGVEVCETDTTNCATTDANGAAQIELPANQETSYTFEKEGYGPYLVGRVTDETFDGFHGVVLFSDAVWAEEALTLGIEYPWTSGRVTVGTLPARAGVTLDLVDATATQYYNDGEERSLDLTETTTSGRGGFVEVSPGEHQVEAGGNVTNCVVGLGWPGDAANRIKVPVRVGYNTLGRFDDCD